MDLKDIFVKYKCDKGIKHGYWKLYQDDFEKVRNKEIDILEIGTFKGESTNAWLEYFPNANIYTIDTFERIKAIDLPCLEDKRVEWAQLDSTSESCNLHFQTIKKQFDFIIDDGLHTPDAQRKTFEKLFEFLKQDGAYYIEDVWMLDKIDINHPWIKSHPNDFTMEKYNKLIKAISKYTVTHHDFSSKKIPDSFILKIRK
jgi:predicted O-methyltransferase YrrM